MSKSPPTTLSSIRNLNETELLDQCGLRDCALTALLETQAMVSSVFPAQNEPLRESTNVSSMGHS